MGNQAIISLLKSTAHLLALHELHVFQVRYYNQAADFLAQREELLESLSLDALKRIPGMSKRLAEIVHEINTTGTWPKWVGLMERTPPGLLKMLEIKGLGPKKVRRLWKERGIQGWEDLAQACAAGQVANLSGFGEKTQRAIQEDLAWRIQQTGQVHYATALTKAITVMNDITANFSDLYISMIGDIRRNMETVDRVGLLIGTATTDIGPIKDRLSSLPGIYPIAAQSGPFAWRGQFVEGALDLTLLFCPKAQFYKELILQTGTTQHLHWTPPGAGQSLGKVITTADHIADEADGYARAGLPWIPPELREGHIESAWVQAGAPHLLSLPDLKGPIHVHTTYSDGRHSLEDMVRYCHQWGYAYVGIADHSQTARYAGGLTINQVRAQHAAIDDLNAQLAPFKIFKGIESDILPDGSLDYPDSILAEFDFVIASIHAGLNMDQATATARLLKAIHNPFTTFLGHLTGRLLLKRKGYPVDHRAIIDACAERGVILELNAHPWRMDIDWRWIHYATQQNVWISIHPDAHDKICISDMNYGIYVGCKGGLTQSHTFNALPVQAVAQHFEKRRAAAQKNLPTGS
ncbi:MAG: helix-hairpin-helix domain-containing protein [Bacteroidota bacterium]